MSFQSGSPVDDTNPLPVTISNPSGNDGLTDTQLRATPVPVSISGTVTVTNPTPAPVTVQGTDGTTARTLKTDTNGNLTVAQVAGTVNTIQTSALPAGTDKSGSITTGGTAQDVAAQNTSRRGLTFQNTSDTLMRVTENGVTATASTGYLIAANGGAMNVSTSNRISVYCSATGKTFTATEF